MATMSNVHHQIDEYYGQQPPPPAQKTQSNKNSLASNSGLYNNNNNNDDVSPRQSYQQDQPRQQAPGGDGRLQAQNRSVPTKQPNNNQGAQNGHYNGFMTHRDAADQNDEHPNNRHNNNNNNNNGGYNINSDHGSQKSLSLEYGKSIKLLRNGDEFFRGQKFVINSRKYRYYDVFLDDISNTMSANFGAVRNIYTPNHGHRVHNLEELEDGKTYVAGGKGRFVRLNYSDVAQGKRLPPHRLPALTRQDYNAISVPQYDRPNNIVIYVYKNGDVLAPPAKILLYRNTLTSFEACLDCVTEKVKLTNGAVLRLYTMEGEHVLTPDQFVSGHSYVAAHKEKFKKCEYLAAPNDFNLSPRLNRKSKLNNQASSSEDAKEEKITPIINPRSRFRFGKSDPINSQPVSNTSSNPSTSGKSNLSYNGYYHGKPYTGWHKEVRRDNSLPPVGGGPKHGGGMNSSGSYPSQQNYYHANQQQQHRGNNKQLNVDKDESGFYKARPAAANQNGYGRGDDAPRTVPDGRNMYVDAPADHKKPVQVNREEIGAKNNNNSNNRNQQPATGSQNQMSGANSQHRMDDDDERDSYGGGRDKPQKDEEEEEGGEVEQEEEEDEEVAATAPVENELFRDDTEPRTMMRSVNVDQADQNGLIDSARGDEENGQIVETNQNEIEAVEENGQVVETSQNEIEAAEENNQEQSLEARDEEEEKEDNTEEDKSAIVEIDANQPELDETRVGEEDENGEEAKNEETNDENELKQNDETSDELKLNVEDKKIDDVTTESAKLNQ